MQIESCTYLHDEHFAEKLLIVAEQAKTLDVAFNWPPHFARDHRDYRHHNLHCDRLLTASAKWQRRARATVRLLGDVQETKLRPANACRRRQSSGRSKSRLRR